MSMDVQMQNPLTVSITSERGLTGQIAVGDELTLTATAESNAGNVVVVWYVNGVAVATGADYVFRPGPTYGCRYRIDAVAMKAGGGRAGSSFIELAADPLPLPTGFRLLSTNPGFPAGSPISVAKVGADLYVGTASGLGVSRDEGQTWE
jgi:hypothetical protein